MRQQYVAQRVRTTSRYLTVQVRIEHGSTIRWAQVKVPWRLLNEQYEEVANYMASEATTSLKETWEQPTLLPLEPWE